MEGSRNVGEEGGSSESGGSESGSEERTVPFEERSGGPFEYFGWVYHLGVNKIGHEFCRLRFLYLRGSYIQMFKRDPHEYPGTKPIRRGYIGHTLTMEELGRRKVSHGDVYVLRLYNRLEETKKGEIACATAGEARKWKEAFDHAKQEGSTSAYLVTSYPHDNHKGEYELSRGGSRDKLNMETEIDLGRHRRRVRNYARGLKKLIKIGQGPESFLYQCSTDFGGRTAGDFEGDAGDAIEEQDWRCVRTVNGVRIFEDVSGSKNGKGVLVKAVGVIDASADSVFEVVLNLDREQRYEWDILTADLELVDALNGHYDVVYGTYDPRYLTRWTSKRDFVFSRQWFRGQDGSYTILQFPAVHKKRSPKSGYRRTKINPSTWEIRNLNSSSVGQRCIATQMLEIHAEGWFGWKNNQSSKFEKSVPYALLSQVAGLKAYIGANPAFNRELTTTVMHSKGSDFSASNGEFVNAEGNDEFYDAMDADSSTSDDDSDNEVDLDTKGEKTKLKNVSWAAARLALKQTSGKSSDANKEFDASAHPIALDPDHFHGSMRRGNDEGDSNCWTSPDGSGFKIRGKTYLKDNAKVAGGDPLLKLIGVDWLKVDSAISNIALHPISLVQSEAGKQLPFILVFNLQVPARPNYSLVLYCAADRPVKENSLLGRFADGTDAFRDSRFKLIPSIKEGYWMVKRAVGTKACLLGKAVTCKYLRQDNFLEIDVDIGSSSVARSVIGLVLGYVTSLVVDLAILIEGQEEDELPEYILGTVRINRFRLDSAIPLKD